MKRGGSYVEQLQARAHREVERELRGAIMRLANKLTDVEPRRPRAPGRHADATVTPAPAPVRALPEHTRAPRRRKEPSPPRGEGIELGDEVQLLLGPARPPAGACGVDRRKEPGKAGAEPGQSRREPGPNSGLKSRL